MSLANLDKDTLNVVLSFLPLVFLHSLLVAYQTEQKRSKRKKIHPTLLLIQKEYQKRTAHYDEFGEKIGNQQDLQVEIFNKDQFIQESDYLICVYQNSQSICQLALNQSELRDFYFHYSARYNTSFFCQRSFADLFLDLDLEKEVTSNWVLKYSRYKNQLISKIRGHSKEKISHLIVEICQENFLSIDLAIDLVKLEHLLIPEDREKIIDLAVSLIERSKQPYFISSKIFFEEVCSKLEERKFERLQELKAAYQDRSPWRFFVVWDYFSDEEESI